MADGPVSKNIQKLLFWEEPSRAVYGVDHSGTLGDYTLIPHMEGSIDHDPGRIVIDPGQGVHHIYDHREKIYGHKQWTLSFKTPLAPSGTLAGDGVAAVPGPAAKLCKTVLGGVELGTGTTVDVTWLDGESGSLTSVASLKPGMAIGFVLGGRFYAREIESIVGTTVTLKVALPSAPQATDVVYGGVTIYLHRNPQAFAQFLVIGEEPDDRYCFRGGFGSVTIELVLSGEGEPMLSFEWEGRAWDYGEDCATDLSAEPFLPEALTGYAPIPDHVGEFLEQVVGTSTLAVTPLKSLSFALALERRAITDPNAVVGSGQGEEGLRYWTRIRGSGPAVTGSFTPSFFEDLTRQQRRDSRAAMYLAYAFGVTTTSGCVLLAASKVQYTASPPGETDGVATETTAFEGRNDTDTVEAVATDLGVSAFRLHLFG